MYTTSMSFCLFDNITCTAISQLYSSITQLAEVIIIESLTGSPGGPCLPGIPGGPGGPGGPYIQR